MTRRLLITGLLAVAVLAGCTSPTNQTTGQFEVLISDQPAAIGDFASLDVTFSEVRLFTEDSNQSDVTIDVNSTTIDLTTVTGTKASTLVNTTIAAGNYTKIELHIDSVDAVLDDSNRTSVDVMVPSNKLMITKNFEITPDSTTSFVFDIHVVKRGGAGGYILRPVISASGVVAEDVSRPQRVQPPRDLPGLNNTQGQQPGPAMG